MGSRCSPYLFDIIYITIFTQRKYTIYLLVLKIRLNFAIETERDDLWQRKINSQPQIIWNTLSISNWSMGCMKIRNIFGNCMPDYHSVPLVVPPMCFNFDGLMFSTKLKRLFWKRKQASLVKFHSTNQFEINSVNSGPSWTVPIRLYTSSRQIGPDSQ